MNTGRLTCLTARRTESSVGERDGLDALPAETALPRTGVSSWDAAGYTHRPYLTLGVGAGSGP